MKKSFLLEVIAVTICFAICLISCNSEDKESGLISQNETFISLNFEGDHVEVTEMPLSRGDKQPYYVVGVLEYNSNISAYQTYAVGIFSKSDDVKVKLKTSKKYEFKVALLYDYLENYTFGDYEVTNEFDYSCNDLPRVLQSGRSEPFTQKTGFNVSTALVDSYYGFLSDYLPSENDICSIELKRVTVGLSVEVEGLKKGYINMWSPLKLDITPSNANIDLLLTHPGFFDVEKKKINDKAEIQVSFNYIDENNKNKSLYSERLEFTRGYKKKIYIKVNNITQEEQQNGLSFSLEDLEIKDETNTTLIDVSI